MATRRKKVKVDGKLVREHIATMEKILGYPIPKGYVVHHKDEDTTNNDPDNLQLMTKKEHDRLHKLKQYKLNQEIANQIRVLYQTGKYTQTQLGTMFSVSHVAIGNIINNKRWKGV